ncbi:membrane metallo-endopeptidase-like 1 [Rhipicephalus microplus]|uniref:membrane metallo-endopeptidase-like 1 n=1 Tax=Rhipicephalus microplus TaxID=6941 RepID=UPI003F6A68B1
MADEIVSTDNLHQRQSVHVAGAPSLTQRFLSSKLSILLLAAIAVLFSGVLPFVAFRAAILSSSRALYAASAMTSRLASYGAFLSRRNTTSSANKQAEDAVTAFDVLMAQSHDHAHARPHHRTIKRVTVSEKAHIDRAHQQPHTQRHRAAVVHDKLLPQVMEHPHPCDSAACQREALNISEQLDESVSPCDDFYAHVCGRWMQQVAVPNGSARVSVDTLTQDYLTDLVDGAFRRYSEELERVADLYNECRSHKSGDFERPLFDELVRGFGNVSWYLSIRTMASRLHNSVWPLFRDVGDTKISASIGAFYRTVNEPALFSIKPTTDSDFPNETLVSIGLPTLVMGSFTRHFSPGDDYSYVSDAMDMILGQSNLTNGIKVNVLNVELTLARAIGTTVPEAPRLVQVQELPSAGKLKWDALFRAMMGENDMNFSSVYVSVDSMRYLYALQEALQELHDVEIMAYLGFRTKLVLAPLLRDNESLSLLGALSVSPFPEWHPPLSRPHYCVRFFEKFEPALSLYAARDDIGRSLRQLRAVSLVDALKKALFEEMATLFPKPFLNHVTRILRSAKWTTLMPDWTHTAQLRAKYVDYFYEKAGRVPVHKQFALLIKRKNANQYQRYLTGIFFDATWTGGLLRTSATVGEDRVDVPPGAFDFFRADADEPSLVPLQMARLGPRVAPNVYRFVFNKALDFFYHTGHQKSWALLDDARSCVWNQFSTNFAPQEDSASNMSLRSEPAGWSLLAHVLAAAPSYRAFLAALDGDLYLRGLERYSSEKLYFVYYALSSCENNDPRFLDRLLEDGDETPAWHAVNGALRNFRAFADAFNCSVGSFMNPEEKCTWSF